MAPARSLSSTAGGASPRRRRRPARWFAGLLVLLVLELVLFWWLAHRIGIGWLLGIAVLATLLGAWLLRREGPRAWRDLRLAMGEGRLPAPEAVRGMLVLGAGVLLVLPGLVSDVLAIVLLLPPVSSWLSHRAARRVNREVSSAFHHVGVAPPPSLFGTQDMRTRPSRATRGDVVEGEIIE